MVQNIINFKKLEHMYTSIQTIALDFIEKKDNNTLSILINRLKPGLTSFVNKFTKNRDLTNEVISNTFINVWEKIDQYSTNYNFSTWVYAIAKNEAIGLLREERKTISIGNVLILDKELEPGQFSSFYSIIDNAQNNISNSDEKDKIFEPSKEEVILKLYDASISAIHKLEEPYKTVMIERELNQVPLQDIADKLGWNLNTVKTRIRKGRKDIEQILHQNYGELIESYKEFQQ